MTEQSPAARKADAGANGDSSSPLLRLDGLRVTFGSGGSLATLLRMTGGEVRAVDGVDLEISAGEVLGVVGESGSGKTTLALAALRLAKPTGGRIVFGERDVLQLSAREVRRFRQDAVMIFQDPHSSLSPRMKVSSLLMEPYSIHNVPKQRRQSVAELLAMVELPQRLADYYPHELSGGQARRVGIARAVALRPRLIVADEPTAGLDVSAASAILNLLQSLRSDYGTAYLIITHDLNVVGYLADTIAVMYLGRVVETGPAEMIYDDPHHPYTRALIASIPEMMSTSHNRGILSGEIPSPRNPPSGCHFHPRCPFAVDKCSRVEPVMETVAPGRTVACIRWRELAAGLDQPGGQSV